MNRTTHLPAREGQNLTTYAFKVVVEPDEDRWRAYVPELEHLGAATWGHTREEALTRAAPRHEECAQGGAHRRHDGPPAWDEVEAAVPDHRDDLAGIPARGADERAAGIAQRVVFLHRES